ncbi:MAG: dienelactone hydrolase family protein [Cyanobacteria bacterium]|nr:dienelactone hydrolase family protein [Cyanobacteriota bacterium]
MIHLDADCQIQPYSGKAPRSLAVLLHGVGANGYDLLPLATLWAPYLPDTLFISPHAPEPYDEYPEDAALWLDEMAPYQWFSLKNITPENRALRAEAVLPELDRFIQTQLAEHGLSVENLLLIGFSQGTIMALYWAIKQKSPCAGILAYSGRLIQTDSHFIPQAKMPIMLVHGSDDPVIPIQEHHQAMETLTKWQFPVTGFVDLGEGHTISENGERLGLRFLRESLEPVKT